MLTPSGWTVLVLKKLRIRWCSSSKSTSYPDVGEGEGYYTRLLWTIPEEEEDTSHKGEHLIKLRRSPDVKIYEGGVGGECNCSLLMKCKQLKSHFTASLKKIRKGPKGSNHPKSRTEPCAGNRTSIRSKPSSRAIAPAPHRSKADEDELKHHCEEIYELYRAIAEGRLSLEKILNLRL